MAKQKAHINYRVLEWARAEAGYSLSEAAELANISHTKKKRAEERLDEWEKGKDYPTHNQLAKLAKAYFRPVTTFYMSRHPVPDSDVADFRTLADEDVGKLSPTLRALVAKMKARQLEVRNLLEEWEQLPEPLPFVGSFRDNKNVDAVAKDIERVLQLPLSRREGLPGNAALLRLIRNSAEDAGIYVLAQGDLGSYHTDIQPSVFRGFALADPSVPFIVLNDNDAKAAQTFTLVHELAHLWIGDTGISNYDPFDGGVGHENERFCNSVSAEFLMPRAAITRAWGAYFELELENAVAVLANDFGISRAAAANRLWKLDLIPAKSWWELYEGYRNEWAAIKAKLREVEKKPPLYFPTKKMQLGRRLIRTVLGAVEAGEITYTRAARILDAAPENFDRLRA